jgi:prepilin-type N-terminal cleavage/methylation domain-containing protein
MYSKLKQQAGFTPTLKLSLLQRCARTFSRVKNKDSIFSTHPLQFSSAQPREFRCQGFTIIEMMVSLGVFSIVITISVGALLMLVATNEQLQAEQSIMSNLSFAVDSMSREIRTGTHYYCRSENSATGMFNPNEDLDTLLDDSVRDCTSGRTGTFQGLAIKEGGDSVSSSTADRILYYFESGAGQIYRKIGDEDPESLTASGIYIRDMSFNVAGSEPCGNLCKTPPSSGGDRDQASVTIYIEASESDDPNDKIYYLQTTVTQRTLDI